MTWIEKIVTWIAIIILAFGELYLLWLHISTCRLMSKMLRELGDIMKEGKA